MTIGGISTTGLQGVNKGIQQTAGAGAAADSVTREIQRQIENQQKKLQDLASNDKLSAEEKMKKRQEIQQEITNLTQQLRQHQMELKREQQQAKDTSANDMAGADRVSASESDNNKSGLSQAGMQAILSAGTSIKQAQKQGSSASKLKGEANVLRSEIKTDAERGSSTEKKQQELAEIEGRAQAAVTSQAYSLGNANDAAESAAKADKDNKTEDAYGADKTENKLENKSENKTEDKSDKLNIQEQTAELQQQTVYASVDIRL